jgi:hypothetical protein
MNRNLLARLGQSRVAKVAALSALVATGAARADSTAAVAAITSAQTDATAVAGALVAMGVAIWGAMYLYRKFFR